MKQQLFLLPQKKKINKTKTTLLNIFLSLYKEYCPIMH